MFLAVVMGIGFVVIMLLGVAIARRRHKGGVSFEDDDLQSTVYLLGDAASTVEVGNTRVETVPGNVSQSDAPDVY